MFLREATHPVRVDRTSPRWLVQRPGHGDQAGSSLYFQLRTQGTQEGLYLSDSVLGSF